MANTFSKQTLVTTGLLGSVGVGWFLADSMNAEVLGAAVVAYGAGVAAATAVLKMNRLMKNGKNEEVDLGNGFSAGVSLVAFFSALGSSKHFFNIVLKNDYSQTTAIVFGVAIIAAGAIQARYSIVKDAINEATQNSGCVKTS